MAASFSDAGDALSGGDLGWRSVSRLPQLFVDAVEKLGEGEIAPLVRSANGFHVLKLNGLPPSARELSAEPEALKRIRIELAPSGTDDATQVAGRTRSRIPGMPADMTGRMAGSTHAARTERP